MKQKIIVILIIFLAITKVWAIDMTENMSEEYNLNEVVDELNKYTDGLDIASMAESLKKGDGINYGAIGNYILDNLLSEFNFAVKTGTAILIVIVLMAIMKSLELEKDSNLSKITNIVGFLMIVIMLLKSYSEIIIMFKSTVEVLTKIVGIISPFMLSILIATGEITTSGIVGPLILFATSLVGILTTYVVLPLLGISLTFKIITNISDVVKLDKLGSMCNSTSMWVVSIAFAVFLGILQLESSITTSVDSVTVKTAQAAVSNLVPVVGKFVSDSLEVVMGASEIIGKTVGVIGIVVICIIAIVPIIKLVLLSVIYSTLSGISESIMADEKITKTIENFSKQYKTMVGIMVGIASIFIIGIAVVINVLGRVSG